MRKIILLFIFMLAVHYNGLAQKQSDRIVSLTIENKTLIKVLYDLSEQHNLQFYFDPIDLPLFLLSGNFVEEPIFIILQRLTNGTQLMILPYKEEGVLIIDRDNVSKEYIDNLVQEWNEGALKYPINDEPKSLSYNFGNPADTGGEKPSLELQLIDENSGEPLIGGVLSNNDLSIGELSDTEGNISLAIERGRHVLFIDYTSYQRVILDLEIYEDATIEIPMSVQAFQIDEIEIIANSSKQKLENAKAGMEVLSMQEMNLLPQITGDIDLLKSIEVIPGVTSTTELSQGFNVRGGSTDQNLILLDDGIIFNPTHIVGFISAFNPDVIGEANLYKGYVDASLGGRVSGVLDVKTEGRAKEKISGKGGIGLSMIKLNVASKVSDKISVNLAARGSFNDYLLRSIANVEIQNSNANFYDLNASIRYSLSEDHKLFFTNYLSKDLFEYNNEFGYGWGNYHSGLQLKSDWKHGFYSKLSLNIGHYNSENFTLNKPDAFRFLTGMKYYKALATLDKKLSEDSYARMGIEYLDISNDEDSLSPEGSSTITAATLLRNGATNIAPFLSYSTTFSNLVKIEAGLRFSYLILENSKENYFNIEPRLSISFSPQDNFSLKASYNRMSQFINQFSNTNGALPSDLWVLSNERIRPSVMDQYSIGALHLSESESYEYGLDLFYKNFQNLYELVDFAQIIMNENLDDELLDAIGKSYGVELLLKKKKGRWQGSLAYTFSRAFRKTIDEKQTINQGTYFPASFDIPHQVNMLLVYQWMPVVSFNFAYVYRTGAPATVPDASFIQDGFLVPLYSNRNESRIDYYSRLDMSINLDLKKSKQDGLRSSFHLGFYNLLGRNNPTNVFFRRSELGNIVPFQFSVVGSVIPNLSWNFVL